MPDPVLTGGCCCGFVRFEVRGPFSDVTLCSCVTCRRASGAPVVAWATAFAPATPQGLVSANYVVVAGEPASFRSSDHGTRTFCPRCGTALTFSSTLAQNELDFTLCSLDDPNALTPADRTFTRSEPTWLRSLGHLPGFKARRPR